jgi:hypothetical protein
MAGHSHFTPANVEEHFEFTAAARKKTLISLLVGLVMLAIGIFFLANGIGEGHETVAGTHEATSHVAAGHLAEATKDVSHEAAKQTKEAVATVTHEAENVKAEVHETSAAVGHHEYHWTKRLWANLWLNSVFFTGIAIVGMFFVSLQYLAKAGWSSAIKRIPEAFPAFLPYVGVLMLIIFLVGGHDLFHWTNPNLFDKASPEYDKIISGKHGYLNTPFFVIRLIAYFAVWFMLWKWLRSKSIQEDELGGTSQFYDMVKIGTGFIVFFGVTSSTSAWDWTMSIDTHWFSTMFGWYHFASWHVSGYCVITLTILFLKDKGYMKYVNDNHLHDLGKFIFGFSIFWSYVWFAQFLLIYYANLPEETIYFHERWIGHDGVFKTPLILSVLLNFVFPLLWFMTRDAKRSATFMKVGACGLLMGHYLDFYQMIMPGTVGKHAGFGLVEFGTIIVFASGFIYIISIELSKASLVAKNHPFLEEALHHDI